MKTKSPFGKFEKGVLFKNFWIRYYRKRGQDYRGNWRMDERMVAIARKIESRKRKREMERPEVKHQHEWKRDPETFFVPNPTWLFRRKTYFIYWCCGCEMERVWRMAKERCACGEIQTYRVCKAALCKACGKDFNVPPPTRNFVPA